MSGTMYDRVLALCDGTLTQAEVADRAGCSYPYVSICLQRNAARGGAQRSVKRGPRGPKGASVAPSSGLPSVRRMALIDGATFRAIRDRAEVVHLTFDKVAGQLLALAVEVGDLDTHFPIKERA